MISEDMGYPAFLGVCVLLLVVGWGGIILGSCEQAADTNQRAERVYTQSEHQWLSTCVSMGESLWRCKWKLASLNALKVEPTS